MNLDVCSIDGLYVELIKFLSFKRVYLHFYSIYLFYFLINLKGFRGFVVRIFLILEESNFISQCFYMSLSQIAGFRKPAP